MVFLIQNSQNRDSAAIQVKLDELIRVSKANNAFMGLEHLTDEELEDIEGKNEGRAKAVLEARKASEIRIQAEGDRRGWLHAAITRDCGAQVTDLLPRRARSSARAGLPSKPINRSTQLFLKPSRSHNPLG